MGKFTPFELKIEVTSAQLSVLEDIHECVELVSKKLKRCLPQSFSKTSVTYINRMIELTEGLDYEWKRWVLEDFEKEMNSTEFFKGIGIQRINPWDLEERDL